MLILYQFLDPFHPNAIPPTFELVVMHTVFVMDMLFAIPDEQGFGGQANNWFCVTKDHPAVAWHAPLTGNRNFIGAHEAMQRGRPHNA